MGETTDLTVQILREIRDETRATREDLGRRIDDLGGRIDGVREEVGSVREELGRRIDETNARLTVVETTLKDLSGQMLLLAKYVKNQSKRQQKQIDAMASRLSRIERRVGIKDEET